MSNDSLNAHRIASDLIGEIAAKWKETSFQRCIQKNGYFLFEFILESPPYVGLPSLDPHEDDFLSTGNSVFRFNPLAQAIRLVQAHIEKVSLTTLDSQAREAAVRRRSKQDIRQMIFLIRDLGRDAMWQSRVTAETLDGLALVWRMGRSDMAREMVNSALDAIRDRAKKHFGPISTKRNRKINQVSLNDAIEKFLPEFRQSGKLPSQRQFAKAMDVSPKAWRTFLSSVGEGSHEVAIKKWYELRLAAEVGTIKTADSPTGD